MPEDFANAPTRAAPGRGGPAVDWPPRAASPQLGQALVTAPSGRAIPALSGPQKAAIVARFLLAEGFDIRFDTLPVPLQAVLAEEMARIRIVDRDTLKAILLEFLEMLEQVGLSFPDGLEGTLALLTNRLSPATAALLLRNARIRGDVDPWERVRKAEPELLAQVLSRESIAIGAIALSQVPVSLAARVLGQMPGPRARRVALAMARLDKTPERALARIGTALADALDELAAPQPKTTPPARVGAILNAAEAELRDAILAELAAADAELAAQVEAEIFTFGRIPKRIRASDVPKIVRALDQSVLVTALAYALPMGPSTPIGRAASFLLENISQRLAATLREEAEARGRVRAKEGEAALSDVVATIRDLVDAGEITFVEDDDG